MPTADWDGWIANEPRRLPHEHVVRFVQGNFASPVAPGTQALDLGCGGGTEVRFLMEQGFDVTAVDASATALAKTQQRVAEMPARLHVQQALLSQLDLPARVFACAIAVGVLDAAGVDQARVAVPRLVDSLRPGGKALLVIAGEEDSRIGAHPELNLHGYTRREVEALIVLEYGVGVWIDSAVTTYQNNAVQSFDWLVTIAKR